MRIVVPLFCSAINEDNDGGRDLNLCVFPKKKILNSHVFVISTVNDQVPAEL